MLGTSVHAAGPSRGLNTLPANRPITMGYVNAIRGATGSEVAYTSAQITTEIAGLNWAGFDAVVHAFAEPMSDGTIGEGLGNFSAYQSALLTEAHSRGKSVILSIGGAYPARLSDQYAIIAASPSLRTTFSQNVAAYLQAKGYDGVDIDWEFPDYQAGGKANFTLLMQALHTAVKAASPNFMVMFGTGPGWYMGSYDFSALSPSTDFFFYFGYDWKNPHNGPMKKPGSTQWTTANDQLPEASVKGGVQYVLNQGFPASKIICGLPFYGSANRSWSAVRDTWAASPAIYLAAIDANAMEVQIGGEWFTTPDCMKLKMDALLKASTSVLPNQATLRGVGTWEIGHEHRTHPDLSLAFAQWIADYTGHPLLPVISIADASVNEGNAGASTLTFTVSLSFASSSSVTVNYATADGTAAAGSDYVNASGTLTFAAGETSKTISVTINGDTTVESNETFTLNLSSPTNATLGGTAATGTIINDDAAPGLPTLSIGGTTIAEGNAGSSNATLTVTLSAASASTVTVNYATANGTATAGSDYTAQSGSLSFAPGQTSKAITIAVLGDTNLESDEAFTVALSSPVNATLLVATATVTITNDDAAPGTTTEVGSPGWTRHYDQTVLTEITSTTPSGAAVWSTGFSGLITVKNNDTSPLSAWTLEFDAPWTTTGSGNAGSWAIAAGHHTVSNPIWQGYTVAAGASVSLDFTGNGIWSAPTNLKFNGSPIGTGDPGAKTFAAWATPYGITDPDADADGDGISNMIEFLSGTNPTVGNGLPMHSSIENLTVNAVDEKYFTVRVPAQFHAKNVEYRIEVSSDLISWKAGTGAMLAHSSSLPNSNGMMEALWRSAQPMASLGRNFFARLVARQVGTTTTTPDDPPLPPVVIPGAPNVPTVSVQKDWQDNIGYTVGWNLWGGPAATSWKLYENGVAVQTGTVTGATPQGVTIDINEDRINAYSYYVEVTNDVGTTASLPVSFLAGGASPIAITELDSVRQAWNSTAPLGASTLTLRSGKTPFTVTLNHPSVLSASVDGRTLQLNGLMVGRSGVKITDADGNVRQFGLRIGAPGSPAELPTYLSVGSVSEDDADVAFFGDFQTGLKNKWVDYRYLYMNGGVKRRGVGWRVQDSVDGSRMIKFVRNSLKLGMIPVITYYNIPDGGEAYTTDKEHMQDEDYMRGYFEDLKFALDIVNREAGAEKAVWVLEPDFIGYMAQNHEDPATLMAQTHAAYDMGVLTGSDPVFPDTMQGLIKAINYTIKKYALNCSIGWQFNLWAFPAGGWVNGSQIGVKGLMRVTDDKGITAGRATVRAEGQAVADYYMSAGILSYGADFISIDKYGLDGGAEGKNSNPVDSTWFWNAEHWGNYLVYTKALHDRTGKPVVLWQLPVGHINHSLIEDPYHPGQLFPDLKNISDPTIEFEDSSPDFFLGNTFVPGAGNRYTYFSQNRAADPGVVLNADGQTVTWNPHMVEARDAGATILLFGDGTGGSTRGRGDRNTDHFWWITQTQRYFLNPVPLNP